MPRDQKGFTLIEMIMAIAIMTTLSVISFTFVSNSMTSYKIASGGQKMGDEAWIAVERMVREVSEVAAAADITVPAAGTTGTTLQFSYTQAAPNNPKTNCANCVDKATAISYSYNAATQQVTRAGTATVVLADGITAFSVIRSAAPGNVITIKITKTDGTNSVTLAESAVLYQHANISENIQ